MKKLLTAFFIILLFSGCVPSEWQRAGFTGKEAPSESYQAWQNADYDASSARRYKDNNITLKELKMWKKMGVYKYDEIQEWKKLTNNDMELVKKWMKFNHNVYAIKSFIRDTNIDNPDMLSKYVKVLKTFDFYKKQNKYRRINLIKKCKMNNITPTKLKQWEKIGVTNLKVIFKLTKNNISIKQTKKFLDSGINNLDLLIEAVKKKISINIIKPYYKVGITDLKHIIVFNKLHLKPKIAKKYANLNKGYLNKSNLQKIIKNCPNGVIVSAFKIAGLVPVYYPNISKVNPFSTKGKCYEYIGKITQLLNENSIVVTEYTKGNSYNGRQSLIVFIKKFPSNIYENQIISCIIKGIGYEKMSNLRGEKIYIDRFKPIIINQVDN